MLDAVADTGPALFLWAPVGFSRVSQNPPCLLSRIQYCITATEAQATATPVGRILKEKCW